MVFLKTLSTSVCAREPLEWAVDLHNVSGMEALAGLAVGGIARNTTQARV